MTEHSATAQTDSQQRFTVRDCVTGELVCLTPDRPAWPAQTDPFLILIKRLRIPCAGRWGIDRDHDRARNPGTNLPHIHFVDREEAHEAYYPGSNCRHGCRPVRSRHAYNAGGIIRAGPALVAPDSSSDPDLVEVDDAYSLGISATYMLRDEIGIELLGALPFEHDIEGSGALDVGSTKHLPPTLLVTCYPSLSPHFQPFVGVGLNYTTFFQEDTTAELDGALGGNTRLSLEDSFGVALELGVDVPLTDRLALNATVWNLGIDTTADVKVDGVTAAEIDVEIDPWVYMLGVSLSF